MQRHLRAKRILADCSLALTVMLCLPFVALAFFSTTDIDPGSTPWDDDLLLLGMGLAWTWPASFVASIVSLSLRPRGRGTPARGKAIAALVLLSVSFCVGSAFVALSAMQGT